MDLLKVVSALKRKTMMELVHKFALEQAKALNINIAEITKSHDDA